MSYATGESRSQKRARQQADKDLEEIMDSPAGRRTIMRILDACGVVGRSMADGPAIYYNEGRRSVGLELIEHMERVVPNSFIALQVDMAKLRDQVERDTREETYNVDQ